MERQNVLLGYIPQRSFPNTNDTSAQRDSDVNFSDVFGGPPRRSSMYEMRQRYSYADAADFDESKDGFGVDGGDETALPYRGSLTGMRDKPVFGEDRRRKGNDFFNDIFKGYESSGSSLRKQQDPFSSAPGLRVMSPPQADPSGISLPSQFSLPAKVMDLPTFGPPTHSSTRSKDQASDVTSYSYSPRPSLSRFSIQSVHGQEEPKNDTLRSFDLQSSLPLDSGITRPEKTEEGGHWKSSLKGSEVSSDGSQFHFSIYKWASKGVPLMTPRKGSNSSRLKETDVPSSSKLSMLRSSSEGSISSKNVTTVSRVETSVDNVSADTVLNNKREKMKHDSHLNPAVVQRALKSDDPKPLRSLFNEKSNDEMTVKAGGSKGMNESNKKVSIEKTGATEKVKKQNALTGPVVDNSGMVKEFAKIFNQEEPSKPKTAVDSQSQSSRRKGTIRQEKEASLDTAGMDHKLQFNLNKEKTLEHESIREPNKVEEHLKQSDKHYSAAKTEIYVPSTTSKPKNASVSSTVPDVSKTVVGETNESLQRDFVMKELPLQKNEKPQPGKDHEDMQAVDAKIRKWSNGKEGNIRSLLSTLQYVLWPESGWKPVPLVDIIEGNAVKRAYQRALLRLHPDKLQQKGAASHQKYIAEKVFDILQEAWTQFNSLGSL